MLFNKFLKERSSVRTYKNTKIDNKTLTRLMYYGEEIEKSYGNEKVRFVLFEEGESIYNKLEDIGGYAGVMIKSPHYIGLQIEGDDEETIIRGAYSMESFITKAYQLELGTCWISLKHVPKDIKDSLTTGENKRMDYIIAIGYPQEKKPYNPIPTSSRLAIEELVYFKEWGNKMDLDELDKRGLTDLFYYARFAPSNRNNQPWRFIINNGSVYLGILKADHKENLTDAGIIMYYFERMAHDSGINSQWQFTYQEHKDYAIVGKCNI